MTQSVSKTIDQHQNEIIDNFKQLSGNREMMLEYLIEFGQTLPPLAPAYKIDDYLIKGCISKVWLVETFKDGRLFFQADSNTAITKGLIALLIKILSGQTIQAINQANLYFIDTIGMHELLSFQRSSGLAYMIKTIKQKALLKSGLIP